MSAPDKRPASNRAFVVPDRILVATDLADTEYLIPHAIAQARACGAALTFVHVIPPGESAALNARAIPHEDSAAMAEAADRKLKQVAAQMRENGIPCDLRVAAGFPRD